MVKKYKAKNSRKLKKIEEIVSSSFFSITKSYWLVNDQLYRYRQLQKKYCDHVKKVFTYVILYVSYKYMYDRALMGKKKNTH